MQSRKLIEGTGFTMRLLAGLRKHPKLGQWSSKPSFHQRQSETAMVQACKQAKSLGVLVQVLDSFLQRSTHHGTAVQSAVFQTALHRASVLLEKGEAETNPEAVPLLAFLASAGKKNPLAQTVVQRSLLHLQNQLRLNWRAEEAPLLVTSTCASATRCGVHLPQSLAADVSSWFQEHLSSQVDWEQAVAVSKALRYSREVHRPLLDKMSTCLQGIVLPLPLAAHLLAAYATASFRPKALHSWLKSGEFFHQRELEIRLKDLSRLVWGLNSLAVALQPELIFSLVESHLNSTDFTKEGEDIVHMLLALVVAGYSSQAANWTCNLLRPDRMFAFEALQKDRGRRRLNLLLSCLQLESPSPFLQKLQSSHRKSGWDPDKVVATELKHRPQLEQVAQILTQMGHSLRPSCPIPHLRIAGLVIYEGVNQPMSVEVLDTEVGVCTSLWDKEEYLIENGLLAMKMRLLPLLGLRPVLVQAHPLPSAMQLEMLLSRSFT